MSRRGVRALALPEKGELLIGRGPDCGVLLEDSRVSRNHALLRVGDEVELIDSGSRNGTRLGGRLLEARERVVLAPGDVVTVGSTVLRLQRVLVRRSRTTESSPLAFVATTELDARIQKECGRKDGRAALLVLQLEPSRRSAALETTALTTREILLASEVEAALCQELRAGDLVAWSGASSYRVLLDAADAARAESVAGALCDRLSRCGVGGELGVALAPRDGKTLARLERVAEQALRKIERPGSNSPTAPPPTAPNKGLDAIIAQVAPSMISVLIIGETGVGKERLASALHARSPRSAAPFLAINCAALSEALFESELFGHERGAFTGADRAKPGLLEAAAGGTLFLDELGEMPLGLQAKLLRVLEQREVLRVGAVQPRPIDVRIVSATNRDLRAEVAARRFRQDLFFRLNGVAIVIPPLRERRSEIEPLARHFLREASAASGRARPPELPEDAIAALEEHDWPGNVRELRNTIERAVILCTDGVIRHEHLQLGRLGAPGEAAPEGLSPDEQEERRRIVEALERCVGNQSYAAEALGISRRMLISRLEKYRIARPRTRRPGVT